MDRLLCGILLIGLTTSASGHMDPTPAMIRTTYCACRCCEESQDICFRHSSIPKSFKCSESMCTPTFCEIWEKAKCSKDCFCEKCKSTLPDKDQRCAKYTKLPEKCACKEEIDCTEKDPEPEEFAKVLKNIEAMMKQTHCVQPCFCKLCREKMPHTMYANCLKMKSPGKDCDCSEVSCPSDEILQNLEKLQKQDEATKGAHPSEKFVKDIDAHMDPDDAQAAKCNMQCFCETCASTNDKIHASCEKMLPKDKIEGCECDPSEITCPSEDVDTHCRLYCFCKGCKTDSRMSIDTLKACQALTKKEQDCFCEEEEDCDKLDLMPSNKPGKKSEKTKKAKKSKKGKLKPKKKEKDEL